MPHLKSTRKLVWWRRREVIMVSNHKTGTTGRANITVPPDISQFLEEYVKSVRPQIAATSVYLFPNTLGGCLDHLTRRIQKLANGAGISLPTCSFGRHAAATAAPAKQIAVSVMMSHSAATQKLIYAANKGASKAVEGSRSMEGLRGTQDKGAKK